MGKKGAKIDLEGTQESTEVGLAAVLGDMLLAGGRGPRSSRIASVGPWPSHPLSGPCDSSPGGRL